MLVVAAQLQRSAEEAVNQKTKDIKSNARKIRCWMREIPEEESPESNGEGCADKCGAGGATKQSESTTVIHRCRQTRDRSHYIKLL